MTNVYTLKITYVGCENRIWREAKISSNAFLCDLGYMILATFDTMAYHLFSISHNGITYELSSDEEDIPDDRMVFTVRLSELGLKIGDKLMMEYDFGCCQEFEIEVKDIEPMGRGQGRAYPKIIAGEGRGIIDDMPVDELIDVIHRIDETGSCDIRYSGDVVSFVDDFPTWDYRKYDIKIDNALLKGRIDIITDGYEELLE